MYSLYEWNRVLRVITPEGNISQIGQSDSYGNVKVNNVLYQIIVCEQFKKGEIKCKYYADDEPKGLMIHDVVYKYLLEHKYYDKISNHNLYELLLKFVNNPERNTETMRHYVGNQDIYIIGSEKEPEYLSEDELVNDEILFSGKKLSTKERENRGWKKSEKGWYFQSDSDIIEGISDYMLTQS